LTQAAKKNKVVTQMGNKAPLMMVLESWKNGLKLDGAHTIHAWTDRPVWPQGIPWSTLKQTQRIDWDLWELHQ
jgi:hypothetical protein